MEVRARNPIEWLQNQWWRFLFWRAARKWNVAYRQACESVKERPDGQ